MQTKPSNKRCATCPNYDKNDIYEEPVQSETREPSLHTSSPVQNKIEEVQSVNKLNENHKDHHHPVPENEEAKPTKEVNGRMAALRDKKKPLCRYGTHRKLDQPRDDIKREIAETRPITQRIFQEGRKMAFRFHTKALSPVDQLLDTHSRKFAKPVYDTKQRPVFRPVDYKGKGTTDERRQIISQYRIVLWELLSAIKLELSHPNSPKSTPSSSPTSNDADEEKDEDQYAEDIPVIPYAIEEEDPLTPSTIPYHISALDLATPDNPFQLLRTHAHPSGKHAKKLNDCRMSTEHRKHGAPGFARKIRLPRCRFGTRRMLDHPRDDPPREVCWFYKQYEDKSGHNCLR
ncbi:hypothetical protein J4E90_010603 [Alternaria incomplexa]|uniref:uncharacterized protein n=1 Tax=Alternaria incomplexa TaxID=1187928 RepID=UPI0022200D21|nr:uncharacterized protein J4E90_010603 [Alternaria incomplexa]KAI4906384.1 hypothetical protein J4E90_010603 [Alternaria incomplexa]